jgi:hypothetical protein
MWGKYKDFGKYPHAQRVSKRSVRAHGKINPKPSSKDPQSRVDRDVFFLPRDGKKEQNNVLCLGALKPRSMPKYGNICEPLAPTVMVVIA